MMPRMILQLCIAEFYPAESLLKVVATSTMRLVDGQPAQTKGKRLGSASRYAICMLV